MRHECQCVVLILVVVLLLTLITNVDILWSPQTYWIMSTITDRSNKILPSELAKYVGVNLQVTYQVLANYGENQYTHEVVLQNKGVKFIPKSGWEIYFTSVHFVTLISSSKDSVKIDHIDGGLFRISLTPDFTGLEPEALIAMRLKSQVTLSTCYVMPHWYVTVPNQLPQVLSSTEDLRFVRTLYKPEQVKRAEADLADPFTPQRRYNRYFVKDFGGLDPTKVLPTPLNSNLSEEKKINLDSGDWMICGVPRIFKREIDVFASKFGLQLLPEAEPCPPTNVVKFILSEVQGVPDDGEAYQITIDAEKPRIEVKASAPIGAFYAVQTLLSLAETEDGRIQHTLPSGLIKDAPRFGYRGLHVDVARNFINSDEIIKLIETIAMYKLNKLHLHLTDDEGWRIAIEGLPELTNVGAKRKHAENEKESLYPNYGSSPHGKDIGSGYYTVLEYKRILRAGVENHVEIIPEIDTPGHSHAAIRAMEARYHRLMMAGRKEDAKEYLLNDLEDISNAMSVQNYRNNAMNPCLESTYKFIDHVVKAIKDMHADVQPIYTVHIGGDEVAANSWKDSPVCQKFLEETKGFPHRNHDLQEYFMRRVAVICSKHGLRMGVWEDGALRDEEPYNKEALNGTDVIAYAWNNQWKSKASERAYKLANAGYKVIMAPATHLYFDHPQEPDPDEWGLNWATRYIDDRMVFEFQPEDLHVNAKFNYYGVPFTAEEMDEIRESKTVLTKPENIIGMQAQLWSELLRDVTMFHSQLFPRLIAFAERAWHRGKWEGEESRYMRILHKQDWTEFANSVGYKELPRLRSKGISYRIPPPGVKIQGETVDFCSLYPGLSYKQRSYDGAEPGKWSDCKNGDHINTSDPNVFGEFVTSDGKRLSRAIKFWK